MHFFDFTSPSAPTRLVRLAMCALLPALVQQAAAEGRPRHASGRSGAAHLPPSPAPEPPPSSTPYLLVCPPPPLRFAEPVEPADPVSTVPAALGPPHPGGLLDEIAALNQQAAMTATPPAAAPGQQAGDSAVAATTSPTPADISASSPAPPSPAANASASPAISLAILPDDTPRAVRAEDVLVYFQFPAATPANDTPPRSSATYRQQ
jgi:hypothetical protein